MSADESREVQEAVVITEKALRKLEAGLRAQFRAFLRPGERIRLATEEEKDFVYSQLSLTLPGDGARLDLEAAIIVQDQDYDFLVGTDSRARLLIAIEFLSRCVDDYFRSLRRERFHIDWRHYQIEGAQIRFRGRFRNPELERDANRLLNDDEEFE